MRAIGVSHTACKDEFRRNLRSHSWSAFSFFIIYVALFRNPFELTPCVALHCILYLSQTIVNRLYIYRVYIARSVFVEVSFLDTGCSVGHVRSLRKAAGRICAVAYVLV